MSIQKFDDQNHTFVIAEAGSNWKSETNDVSVAKNLIDIAANAGADAVKFQTFTADLVYVKNAGSYNKIDSWKKNINEIFDQYSMPHNMIKILHDYALTKNLKFLSTPFSIFDAKAVDPFVEFHKLASYEINHVPLIEFLSQTKKPIILSTGASTDIEIEFALNQIKKYNGIPAALLQCTSSYPCPPESLNLFSIPYLQKKYHLPVGLSDHSLDPIIAPLTAVGLGASIIEKHFTYSRKAEGPDHFFAIEPEELKSMVRAIRIADQSKGKKLKEILDEEKSLRNFATRSIQAITNISKGDELQFGTNFDILRPGHMPRGAEAMYYERFVGKKANKDIQIGHGIHLSDIS